MSIVELGALGEFVGAMAVLVTLVYLVLQIRQNTRSIRSQSRFHVLETVASDMKIVQTSDYWDVARKISSGSASRADRTKWAMTLTNWFSHQEMLYWEVVDGTLPESFSETLEFRVAGTLMHPEVRSVWDAWRGLYTREFQEYVDDLFERDLAEIVGPARAHIDGVPLQQEPA
jgi:hypothetical protein